MSESNEVSFAELFRQQTSQYKEGEVVQGTVLSIDDDHVQVDVGGKSEGLVAAWEFMSDDGKIMIAESGPGRIIEIDRKGKIHREIKLKVNRPNPHRDTRLFLPNRGTSYSQTTFPLPSYSRTAPSPSWQTR